MHQRITASLDYERGYDRGNGAPIKHGTMTRYRLACAAIMLGVEFDWVTLSLPPPTAGYGTD